MKIIILIQFNEMGMRSRNYFEDEN